MQNNVWKKFFSDYVLVQAETALSIAIIGSIFAPDMRIGFSYFFLPAILGLFYMLPCLPLLLKEDLKPWQIMLQRVIEWIFLEIGTLWAAKLILGPRISNIIYLAVFASVLIFQVLTYVIADRMDRQEVDELNQILKEQRERDNRE